MMLQVQSVTIEADKQKLRWVQQQINEYKRVFPRYKLYARTLQNVLEKVVSNYSPAAIIQSRAKTIPSFADKIQRKRTVHNNPVKEFTDLCGVRIITNTTAEVKAVCDFIENHFDVDWDNTQDVRQRLKPTEFGYLSVHYIVKFKEGDFPSKEVDVQIPEKVYGLKAEIQVRTILEHAWADFTHDLSYKGSFKIPDKWLRELASLAATLEIMDNEFSRIRYSLENYASNYDTYMNKEQMKEEIERLKIVLKCDPKNVGLAYRIGKIARTFGDWQEAISVLSKYAESNYQPILRELGVAMCKRQKNSKSREYRKGQEYLEKAIELPSEDSDALASLAGTWKKIDEDKARELYRRAFEIDPSYPYALANFLEYEIAYRRDNSIIPLVRHVIEASIKRCREQADVRMNLPWAFYDIGKFYLLLGKPFDSIANHAKALQISTEQKADWTIDTSLAGINKLTVIQDQLPGYEWVRRLLLIGLASKFSTTHHGKTALEEVKRLASKGHKPIVGPVLILVGGSGGADVEQQMQFFRDSLLEAFKNYNGTIIGGGTTSGISGIVGQAQETYVDSLHTIGYVPRALSGDVSVDTRYHEIRYVEDNNHSPMESIQSWTDLIASGVDPSNVKLLGINGGAISAAEYRIALALGVRVAVIQGSEHETAKLLSDKDWKNSKTLIVLPSDQMTIKAFVGPRAPKLRPKVRETIAEAIHETYRTARKPTNEDPSLVEWKDLPEYLKESNRQQADHIVEKLLKINCDTRPVLGKKPFLVNFTDDEVEVMAEMEHARWNVERLLDGWKWGEKKDVVKKINPYLVSWSELSEGVKEWDRETVRKIPDFLAKAGIEIIRKKKSAHGKGKS